jgi:hypothetical protein
MREQIIDVDAEVSVIHPVPGLSSACRAVIIRGDSPETLFAPAPNMQMRGRRPSGVVFQADDVPKECRGVVDAEQPEYAVSKRTAKSVAEELTTQPVSCKEQAGHCYIEVRFPGRPREFHGRTWFLALTSLKQWLDDPMRK